MFASEISHLVFLLHNDSADTDLTATLADFSAVAHALRGTALCATVSVEARQHSSLDLSPHPVPFSPPQTTLLPPHQPHYTRKR